MEIKLIARSHDSGNADGMAITYRVLCDVVGEYELEVNGEKSRRRVELGSVELPVVIVIDDDYDVERIGVAGERSRFGIDIIDLPDNIVWEDVDLDEMAEQYARECREAYAETGE